MLVAVYKPPRHCQQQQRILIFYTKFLKKPSFLLHKKNKLGLQNPTITEGKKLIYFKREIRYTLRRSLEINVPVGHQDQTVARLMLCWISILFDCQCVRMLRHISTTTEGETWTLLESLGAARGFMSQREFVCAAVFNY